MLVSTLLPAGRLAVFLQRIASLSALSGIILEVAHIPGVANDEADMLSRWDGRSQLPTKWQMAYRVRLPVQRLWFFRSDVRLWPANAPLLWQPPVS